MKYNHYTLVRASGQLETIKVPRFFDPYTVAKQLPHTLVFLTVEKGQTVYGRQPIYQCGSEIVGPAIVLVHNEQHYRMPHKPVDDLDAAKLWREYGPESYRNAA